MTSEINKSNKCIRLFLIALAVLMYPAAAAYSQSQKDAYRTEHFTASGPVTAEIETSGGSILLQGDNTGQVRVEMYVRRGNRYVKPAQNELKNWEIEISQRGNKIIAAARAGKGSGWFGNRESISFKVYVPVQTEGRLRTSGGRLTLENLEGAQTARTSGGSISAKNIKGDVELRTSGGRIVAEQIDGNANARTSGGSVAVSEVTGRANVRTSGGSITLQNVSGSITAGTSGGSVRAALKNPGSPVELRTSGGSIRIKVPETAGYTVDLSGSSISLPEASFKGEKERRTARGELNGGGAVLKAKTSGGSVRIEFN